MILSNKNLELNNFLNTLIFYMKQTHDLKKDNLHNSFECLGIKIWGQKCDKLFIKTPDSYIGFIIYKPSRATSKDMEILVFNFNEDKSGFFNSMGSTQIYEYINSTTKNYIIDTIKFNEKDNVFKFSKPNSPSLKKLYLYINIMSSLKNKF